MGIFKNTQTEAPIVLAVETTLTEVAPSPSPSPSEAPCRKTNTEKEGFVENVKDYFSAIIHTPMDEHKACFKHTVQKMTHLFKEKTSAPKEGENSVVPLQTASKN